MHLREPVSLLRRHRNDEAELRKIVGHGWLLWFGVSSSLLFGKTLPARRIPVRRGKSARGARPQPDPLRRRTAMRQPFPASRLFSVALYFILFSRSGLP